MLGWSTATVYGQHSRWAQEGETLLDVRERGERRNQNLSAHQDAARLAAFAAKAQAGGMRHVNETKQALEEQVGATVAACAVYRKLDRHGWRKAVLRLRHPKADVAALTPFFKKLRRSVCQEVARQAKFGRYVRLMMQIEGKRFGMLGKH